MDTLLVRLKPNDARRGFVLKRYSYNGIHFHEERGWYRVTKEVGEYLKTVRQVAGDPHAPAAFDVCTEQEATALDAQDEQSKSARMSASASIPLSVGRHEDAAEVKENAPKAARNRKEGV